MTDFQAVIYGVIQGLFEFLPVSSSGHLALLPYFLKMKDPGVFFDLFMHVGTALSVIVYFRKKILSMLSLLISSKGNIQRLRQSQDGNFLFLMLVATVCSVLLIVFIKPLSESVGRSPAFIAFNLIVFGILLWASDFKAQSNRPIAFKSALIIGLAQAVAIFPGVSRSGITLTAGRFLGYSREQVGEFSFLLSLPIILMGAAYNLLKLLMGGGEIPNASALVIGCTVSFVVGIAAIHFFLQLLKKAGFWIYTVYRIVLGIILLGQGGYF